ncbi:adenylosuccinate lyase [Roseivivax lentus]|nr:adenylosuccinate lyase [Roseivivax lentus]
MLPSRYLNGSYDTMIRTALTALALTVASTFSAMAACGHDSANISCADGMVYDSETGSCKVVSG